MNWTAKDELQQPRDIERCDTLDLTDHAHITIQYSPWRSCHLWLTLPYEAENTLNVNDRDASRATALRAMLPMAEAVLIELRKAVAELDAIANAERECIHANLASRAAISA